MEKDTPAAAQSQPAAGPSPYRPDFFWAALILGAVVVLIGSRLGFTILVYSLFFVAACLILSAIQPRQRLTGCTWLIIVGFILVVSVNEGCRISDKSKNAEVKQNLHSIQLALERYATDRGSYPPAISRLMSEGYMPELPPNPFRYREASVENPPAIDAPGRMHPIGETALPLTLEEMAGQFVYLPQWGEYEGGSTVTNYTLIAFGKQTPGWLQNKLFPARDAVPIIKFTALSPAGGSASSDE